MTTQLRFNRNTVEITAWTRFRDTYICPDENANDMDEYLWIPLRDRKMRDWGARWVDCIGHEWIIEFEDERDATEFLLRWS
jgi:hypothetical protein